MKLQGNLIQMWKTKQENGQEVNRMNSFWGDNTDDKDNTELRIISCNINGLSEVDELSQYIIGSLQLSSDIACFQEINIDTRQYEIVRKLKQVVAKMDDSKGDAIHMTSSRRIVQDGYRKRGGTMIRVSKKFAGSALDKQQDPHGRWCSISIEGSEGRRLFIYSVYRVCYNTVENAGTQTTWFQEYSSLLEDGIKFPNPRQQILDDLETDIRMVASNPKHYIMVCMDANESTRTKGKNSLQIFLRNSGLIDPMNHIHPQLEEVPTHINGSRQIDYCFVSPNLLPYVTKGGILPLNYSMISDHRTIFIDIKYTHLLQGEWIDPIGPTPRTLRLKNINATTKYIRILKQYFQQHRIREKLVKIANGLESTRNISLKEERMGMINRWAKQLDKLDELRITLMLAAEKRCQRKGITKTYQWSIDLMEAGQKITYWKSRKTFKIMDIKVTEMVGYTLQLHKQYSIPDTELSIEEIKNNLKNSWKNLRRIQREDRAHRTQYLARGAGQNEG